MDIINNIIINIIKNSMGCEYIKIDERTFSAIEFMREENNELIYNCEEIARPYYAVVEPMMEKLYHQFIEDINKRKFTSPIFKHHLNNTIFGNCYRNEETRQIIADPNEIVVDFIASMTDDYFVDVFKYLFPEDPLNKDIVYTGYFEEQFMK